MRPSCDQRATERERPSCDGSNRAPWAKRTGGLVDTWPVGVVEGRARVVGPKRVRPAPLEGQIEQRIGRVDRLGQESASISVINIFHKDTIDDRIYSKLYDRLKLCETALGGFEDILGEEIQELTRTLFSSKLSPEEEARQIELTRQAIENRRRIEEDLIDIRGGLLILVWDWDFLDFF